LHSLHARRLVSQCFVHYLSDTLTY